MLVKLEVELLTGQEIEDLRADVEEALSNLVKEKEIEIGDKIVPQLTPSEKGCNANIWILLAIAFSVEITKSAFTTFVLTPIMQKYKTRNLELKDKEQDDIAQEQAEN